MIFINQKVVYFFSKKLLGNNPETVNKFLLKKFDLLPTPHHTGLIASALDRFISSHEAINLKNNLTHKFNTGR